MSKEMDKVHHKIALAVKQLDLSKIKIEKTNSDRSPITLWVPPEYHEKYALIQKQTGNGFGRHIRKTLMTILDSMEFEAKG